MSFAADVKNELCKAEHSRKQLELLSKGAAYAMTEDGDGCFFNTENKKSNNEFLRSLLQKIDVPGGN